MPWKQVRPAMKMPRVEKGVDYGAERTVLFRRGNLWIGRRPGHTSWICQGQQGYYPSSISMFEDGEYINKSHLVEGQVTKVAMTKLRVSIANHLGLKVIDVPTALPRGYTLVWEEELS